MVVANAQVVHGFTEADLGGAFVPVAFELWIIGKDVGALVHAADDVHRFRNARFGQGQQDVLGALVVAVVVGFDADFHLLVLSFVRHRGGAQEQGEEKNGT